MEFSDPRFFVFLTAVLVVLRFPFQLTRKKNLLALASCTFYAAWDYRYLGLLLLVSGIDYLCALRIHVSADEWIRKTWLWASITSNLAILGYFKYYNFFIDTINIFLTSSGTSISNISILLPAGISFYTFKSMSYTIDVYRRHIAPERSPIDYTTFITFFPELIAGPIVRASVFLPQMSRSIRPCVDNLTAGASIALLGLTKKALLADQLATVADPIFESPQVYSAFTLWCGALAYTLQIYCDFSGYSDMAIGTAKMIGYDLPENFNMPYLATNITEFWRRWHITLSTWLRDYLYIPLGGNRKGRTRTYLNLMITMILGGLWHGASWNFVIWGALHGVALAAHKYYKERLSCLAPLPSGLSHAFTFVFVLICWIPFRCQNLGQTQTMLSGMLFSKQGGAVWLPEILAWAGAVIVSGHILGTLFSLAARSQSSGHFGHCLLEFFDARLHSDRVSGWYVKFGVGTVAGSWLLATWLITILFFGAKESSPFIYFQF